MYSIISVFLNHVLCRCGIKYRRVTHYVRDPPLHPMFVLYKVCASLTPYPPVTIQAFTQKVSQCTNVDCVKTAASLLALMDPKADPCTDFYRYACGTFLDNPEIPPGAEQGGPMIGLQDRINRLILKVGRCFLVNVVTSNDRLR